MTVKELIEKLQEYPLDATVEPYESSAQLGLKITGGIATIPWYKAEQV